MYRTNTFQGIIITSQALTYAVFIYECGGMEWDRGVIGWQSNASNYKSHPLSGQADNNDIGCLYSDDYSAIVYRLSEYWYVYLCSLMVVYPVFLSVYVS